MRPLADFPLTTQIQVSFLFSSGSIGDDYDAPPQVLVSDLA